MFRIPELGQVTRGKGSGVFNADWQLLAQSGRSGGFQGFKSNSPTGETSGRRQNQAIAIFLISADYDDARVVRQTDLRSPNCQKRLGQFNPALAGNAGRYAALF